MFTQKCGYQLPAVLVLVTFRTNCLYVSSHPAHKYRDVPSMRREKTVRIWQQQTENKGSLDKVDACLSVPVVQQCFLDKLSWDRSFMGYCKYNMMLTCSNSKTEYLNSLDVHMETNSQCRCSIKCFFKWWLIDIPVIQIHKEEKDSKWSPSLFLLRFFGPLPLNQVTNYLLKITICYFRDWN